MGSLKAIWGLLRSDTQIEKIGQFGKNFFAQNGAKIILMIQGSKMVFYYRIQE